MSPDSKYAAILQYVERERVRLNIGRLTSEYKPEPSGESFNEFDLLLDVQLMTTPEGVGAWRQLLDATVLDGVYRRVAQRSLRH